jgi:hypothetical protein
METENLKKKNYIYLFIQIDRIHQIQLYIQHR